MVIKLFLCKEVCSEVCNCGGDFLENGELKLHRLVVGHRYSLTYHILHILKIVFHGQYSISAIYQNFARCHVLKCVIIGSATLDKKRKKERKGQFICLGI